MAKLTQKARVVAQLKEVGFVSRNWALGYGITRLAAIAALLKEAGWELVGEERDGDFRYSVKSEPRKPKYAYELRDGVMVETRV